MINVEFLMVFLSIGAGLFMFGQNTSGQLGIGLEDDELNECIHVPTYVPLRLACSCHFYSS